MYPDFILRDLYVSARPQVVLFRECAPSLRPDFMVQRPDQKYIDIVELKTPQAKLVCGSENRPYMSHALVTAIAQLKEYKGWFDDAKNRQWFRSTYGLEGFAPYLTLVIGRQSAFPSEIVRRKVLDGQGVHVLTYDELLEMARLRYNKVRQL